MNIKPVRNDQDLLAAFRRLECIFQAEAGTPEADEMEVLVTLIEAYESKHYPIGPADPIDAIKFRMEQQGLTPRDLEPYIGFSGRVSDQPTVTDDEKLARFVMYSKWVRSSDSTVRPDAFIPYPYPDLSGTRHGALTDADMWRIGQPANLNCPIADL